MVTISYGTKSWTPCLRRVVWKACLWFLGLSKRVVRTSRRLLASPATALLLQSVRRSRHVARQKILCFFVVSPRKTVHCISCHFLVEYAENMSFPPGRYMLHVCFAMALASSILAPANRGPTFATNVNSQVWVDNLNFYHNFMTESDEN